VIQTDGHLDLRPGSKVPPDLRVEVRNCKDDLLELLSEREPTAHELLKIVKAMSPRMCTPVVESPRWFSRVFLDERDSNKIPSMYTVYTVDELTNLFGVQQYSADELRLIHVAKKHGGRVRPKGTNG
jgi:hypothetical protein